MLDFALFVGCVIFSVAVISGVIWLISTEFAARYVWSPLVAIAAFFVLVGAVSGVFQSLTVAFIAGFLAVIGLILALRSIHK